MARRRRRKEKQRRQAAQATSSFSKSLESARQQLDRGRPDLAFRAVERALPRARTAEEKEAAIQLLKAATLAGLEQAKTEEEIQRLVVRARQYRLAHPLLDAHWALWLWQQGNSKDALPLLETAASQLAGEELPGKSPGLPHLHFLVQLLRWAAGKKPDPKDLAPEERNALQLLESLAENAPPSELPAPLLGEPLVWQALLALHGQPVPVDEAQLADQVAAHGLYADLLLYIRGLLALRRDDFAAAKAAWLQIKKTSDLPTSAVQNLAYMRREEITSLAEAEDWGTIATLSHQVEVQDKIWAETAGLAFYHLGWQAAQAGKWHDALEAWEEAAELWPSRRLAQNLALAHEMLGNWYEAAVAWRDMVRRRPRKKSHPDYLTDGQVAALWAHAGECYAREAEMYEAITCYQNALKYRPDEIELRRKLMDAYMAVDRVNAARNEAERILERDPDNIPALTLLAHTNPAFWGTPSIKIWQRILELEPENQEARDAVARSYLMQRHLFGMAQGPAYYEEALKVVPNHPELLLALAEEWKEQGNWEKACETYVTAYRAHPHDLDLAHIAIHELLHLDADELVEVIIQEMRERDGFQPSFWSQEAVAAMECDLGIERVVRLLAEGERLLEKPNVDMSKEEFLLDVLAEAYSIEEKDVVDLLRERIQKEFDDRAVRETAEALELLYEQNDKQAARRVFNRALRQAHRTGNKGLEEFIRLQIDQMNRPALPDLDFRDVMRAMLDIMGEEDTEDFDEFFDRF